MQRQRTGVTKIRAGLYRHNATGRLIALTLPDGPRGGSPRRWELASDDPYSTYVLDGFGSYSTLRAAAAELDEEARSR